MRVCVCACVLAVLRGDFFFHKLRRRGGRVNKIGGNDRTSLIIL